MQTGVVGLGCEPDGGQEGATGLLCLGKGLQAGVERSFAPIQKAGACGKENGIRGNALALTLTPSIDAVAANAKTLSISDMDPSISCLGLVSPH